MNNKTSSTISDNPPKTNIDLKNIQILVTGAGSGGHVITALSVVQQIKKHFPKVYKHLLYVGAPNLTMGGANKPSIEEDLCLKYNVPFTKIRAGKVRRTFNKHTIPDLLKVFLSFYDAFFLILKTRPKVILSMGGYVSLPIIFWGKIFGAKIVIHEQTVNIGLSNKLASYFADKILLSFKDAIKYIPKHKQDRVIVTGYPIRESLFKLRSFKKIKPYLLKHPEMFSKEYIKELEYLNRSKRKMILVTGGGLGSHIINMTVYKILPKLLKKYIVVVQTGDNPTVNDYDKFKKYQKKLPEKLAKNLIVRKFHYDERAFLYNRANLLIGRSGAGSVFEAALFKLPSILIPIPWVTKNEQYQNALKLKQVGLATIIQQKDLTTQKLLSTIETMLQNPPQPDTILLNKIFKPTASYDIAKIVVDLAYNK